LGVPIAYTAMINEKSWQNELRPHDFLYLRPQYCHSDRERGQIRSLGGEMARLAGEYASSQSREEK
jgi:hypothetical protein